MVKGDLIYICIKKKHYLWNSGKHLCATLYLFLTIRPEDCECIVSAGQTITASGITKFSYLIKVRAKVLKVKVQ